MKRLPPNHLVRSLSPADDQRLLDFFHSHTPDTVYLRYGYPLNDMTHEHAAQLVGVDQDRNVALGVFERVGSDEVLHAIGRYYTEVDNVTAELGVVVRESKRRLGFATRLLFELAGIARSKGVTTIRAYVLHDNFAMRDLASRFAQRFTFVIGTGAVNYYMRVDAILEEDRRRAAEDCVESAGHAGRR
jgi:ribosomal protein S18 acetylase RimI-like enzyme